ncbi:hypothetical protein [Klebsiella quasipneumoniae]|nr:hypothetical protein [Klebsiella quasipneumoniae]
MRMSLMFAAVTLLTGINLFFIPFQPVPALWGAILAVAFVLINVVADKLRLWSGIAWIIVAGIIITLMLKGKEPGDEFRVLITVFAFLASIWYREGANKQVISSQADSLIKISRIWADFFPANTSNQPI